MSHPIVIAYHLVWTIYGYWLPNDLRGSTSKVIRNDLMKEVGELHYGRKKLQPVRPDLLRFFAKARPLLRFPVREFTPPELACLARAFAQCIEDFRYTCWACAILPDHVHLVIRKHRDSAEQMIANLQRDSHVALRDAGFFDQEHPIWGGHGWNVFLDHPDDVWRTIDYVEKNLSRAGRSAGYEFVKPYDNWPLHEGHSLNSPYVRRLRRNRRS